MRCRSGRQRRWRGRRRSWQRARRRRRRTWRRRWWRANRKGGGSRAEASGGPITTLTRVLLHRVVDQVVDGAFQLLRHLLELLPKGLAALKASGNFLVRIRHHTSRCTELGQAASRPPAVWLANAQITPLGDLAAAHLRREGAPRQPRFIAGVILFLGAPLHGRLDAIRHEVAECRDLLGLSLVGRARFTLPLALLGALFTRGGLGVVSGVRFDLG
jgi:hypothetical protein